MIPAAIIRTSNPSAVWSWATVVAGFHGPPPQGFSSDRSRRAFSSQSAMYTWPRWPGGTPRLACAFALAIAASSASRIAFMVANPPSSGVTMHPLSHGT